MIREENKYSNNATPLQCSIIGEYISYDMADFLKDSNGFAEPSVLKDEVDKDNLFLSLTNILDCSSVSFTEGFPKLKELLHESDKSNLHDRRYDNQDITQRDVAIETSKQLDKLFGYDTDTDKNFIQTAYELFNDKEIKLSQMSRNRAVSESAELEILSFQERIQNERNIRNNMHNDLIKKSLTVGAAFGTFVGGMAGIQFDEDNEHAEGFDATRAFIVGIAAATASGMAFYSRHCIHQRRLFEQREQNAQNRNTGDLELA